MAYDVVVLGSGTGGYPSAIRASQLGFKVAIIEKENLGGVCLNWGCIPTKALLKSAQVYQDILHAKEYGIEASGAADFPAVIKRSRGVADKMSKGVQFLMRKNKIDVIMGNGKLKAKGQIEVTGADGKTQIVEGKHIIVATGARSRELPNLKHALRRASSAAREAAPAVMKLHCLARIAVLAKFRPASARFPCSLSKFPCFRQRFADRITNGSAGSQASHRARTPIAAPGAAA